MSEPVSSAPAGDRCPRHDFPLDAAGCALCRQEAAQQGYAGGTAPAQAVIPRKRGDPAVWIIGGALTFAGCVIPLATGTVVGLLAWLILDTGVKLTFGIALGAALLALFGVLNSK
ncbi:MAG: hypothetical protein HY907_21575 [Deltaproteobacteria bacterium]|nr:hypothetical protein [Deltaproteobacteria bacterium]